MHPSLESSNDVVEDLRNQIGQLRRRLEAVERVLGRGEIEAAPEPVAATAAAEAAESSFGAWSDATGVTSLLGISLLGLAFAYLLRAFAETKTLDVSVGVGIGITYALGWLVWAAHTPAAEKFTASIRALTSVLVLVPLLWEAEVRWQSLSAWASAGAVTLFAITGLGISWRKNLTIIAWITSLAGLVAAASLMIATKDLLPFTIALLALAAAVEASACLEHWLGERWIVAAAANFSVLLMTFVVTRPGGIPEGYVPLSPQVVLAVQISLLVIYLASTFVRTLARGFRITNFEIAQCVVAFLISALGSIRVAQGHPAMILTVGVFCASCAAASYGVSFAFLTRHPEKNRNFQVYTAFGLILAMAGTWLIANVLVLASIWSALAVTFVAIGSGAGRMTLKWHATAFLLLATVVSGTALASTQEYLSAAGHPAATPGLAAWVTGGASLLAYLLALRVSGSQSVSRNYRAVCAVLALLATWNLAALAAGLFTPLCGSRTGGPDYCPTILTTVLAGFVLLLAAASRRWDRQELKWVAVLCLLLATYKLVIQDLQQGHTVSITLSLLIYGGTMVLFPRLFRKGRAMTASV